MRKIFTLLMVAFATFGMAQSPGDIMVTGFCADSNDNVAFVVFDTIQANDTIWITDEEWTGSAFGTGEGDIMWSHTSAVNPGTVIVIDNIASGTIAANIGTATAGASRPNFSGSGDEVYFYFGTLRMPTTFLGALNTDAAGWSVNELMNTGLIDGTTGQEVGSDDDIFDYIGSRSGFTQLNYTDSLNVNTNFNIENGGGNQAGNGNTPDLPFDATPFSIVAPAVNLPPTVSSATLLNGSTILVVFSDSISTTSSANPANFNLTPMILPSGATLNPSQDSVTISLTAALADGVAYQLIIDSIVGTNGAQMTGPDTSNFVWNASTPNIVITEIMYNSPDGPDSLEFVEILNAGSSTAALGGMMVAEGFDYTVPAGLTLPAGQRAVIARDPVIINAYLGYSQALPWTSGGLSNSGEDLLLVNSLGDTIDYVDYDDGTPWPVDADGNGTSLVLCDSTADNNLAASWGTTQVFAGMIGPDTVFASPGAANTCFVPAVPPVAPTVAYRTIAPLKAVDTAGVADSTGINIFIEGIVYGVDMDGGATVNFTVIDATGGISVRKSGNFTPAYTVTQGDSVRVYGTVGQFRGLAQINGDSMMVMNSGNAIGTPALVTVPSELTESEYVQINSIELIADAGFGNWDAISGTDTFTLRIDSDTDIDDSLTLAVGDSLCSVVGIGGQFASSFNAPWNDGWQLIPQFFTDLDTSCGGGGVVNPPVVVVPTLRSIGSITTVDANGELDSAGVECFIEGIVHGTDLQGAANANNAFVVIDATGGMSVFKGGGFTPAYMVTPGDSVRVYGSVGDFNGLAQISADSMDFINAGNALVTPAVVTTMDESTESEWVRLENLEVVSMPANTGSFNFDVFNGIDTIAVRVDSDTDLDTLTFTMGDSICAMTGIGGQFDSSIPKTGGYQFFPHFASDVDTGACPVDTTPGVGVEVKVAAAGLTIFPNPADDVVIFSRAIDYRMIDITGKIVAERRKALTADVSELVAGVYLIVTSENETIRLVVK